MSDIPERDWKYLRSIQPEMLEELSRRINDEVRALLARGDLSEREKRAELYGLVKRRDKIVALCFDDWRRSTILVSCLALRRHGLLTSAHLEKLDPETQSRIRFGE
jgi:hypothetical protein